MYSGLVKILPLPSPPCSEPSHFYPSPFLRHHQPQRKGPELPPSEGEKQAVQYKSIVDKKHIVMTGEIRTEGRRSEVVKTPSCGAATWANDQAGRSAAAMCNRGSHRGVEGAAAGGEGEKKAGWGWGDA